MVNVTVGDITKIWWVVFFTTPLTNMTSSIGMIRIPIFFCENKIHGNQTTNQDVTGYFPRRGGISQPGDCGDNQSLGRDDLVETWGVPEVASMPMFGEEKQCPMCIYIYSIYLSIYLSIHAKHTQFKEELFHFKDVRGEVIKPNLDEL